MPKDSLWKKGQSGNPAGRPPGYQDFIVRAKHLIGLYNIEEIKKTISDETIFGKLSVFDGMVMRRIAEAVSDNGRGSMDSLLDRLLGKPPQHITQEIDATVEDAAKNRRRKAKERAKEVLDTLALKKPKQH